MDSDNNDNNKNQWPALIVDGGISELVLANVLQVQCLPYKTFGRDLSPTSRSQVAIIGLNFGSTVIKFAIVLKNVI